MIDAYRVHPDPKERIHEDTKPKYSYGGEAEDQHKHRFCEGSAMTLVSVESIWSGETQAAAALTLLESGGQI